MLRIRMFWAIARRTWRDLRTPMYFGRQYSIGRWRSSWRRYAELLAVDDDGTIWFWPF